MFFSRHHNHTPDRSGRIHMQPITTGVCHCQLTLMLSLPGLMKGLHTCLLVMPQPLGHRLVMLLLLSKDMLPMLLAL